MTWPLGVMEQVAQLVQMANAIISEMGSLRQAMTKQVQDMEDTKKTIDASVPLMTEVILKADLPEWKVALMKELGTDTAATFQNYANAMREGIKTMLDANNGIWRAEMDSAAQQITTLVARDIEREKTVKTLMDERIATGSAPTNTGG